MDRADKQWHARAQAQPAPPPVPRVKQPSQSRRPKGTSTVSRGGASGQAGGVVLPPIGKKGSGSPRNIDTAQTTTVGGPTPRQEFSDRSYQQAGASPRPPASSRRPIGGAAQEQEVSRMRQELARQFGSVQRGLAQVLQNPKRVTSADLASALRRIDHCSEDEARRIFQRLDVKMRGVLTFEEISGEETAAPASGTYLESDAMTLAQGNEEVIRRAADLAAANAELKRQLSIQADEVTSLESDSRKQRDLFLEHERQVEMRVEKVRQDALAEAEQTSQRAVAKAQKDAAEEFKKQIHEAEEARQRSQDQVAALQDRIESLDKRGPRVEALEMELRLVRERLEREVEGRRVAEEKVKDGDARYSQLEVHMGKLQRENDELQRKLEEQTEAANFHKEVCGDLQGRMDDVAMQAEQRILKEIGKKEAISRLESILPKNILLKAMS